MKTNFTKIIAAYVPSKPSKAALLNARDLAQRHNASLTILNVNPEKSEFGVVRKEVDEIMAGSTVNYDLVEREGAPYREILSIAERTKADLIVMGTHGSTQRDPDWIGGNAFKVLSGSTCPVITFTGLHTGIGFKNIVLPIADASETRQKVPLAVSLAKAYNATLHIAIVNKNEDKDIVNTLKIYASQAEGYCEEHGVAWTYTEIYNKNIADACIEYAKEVNADLIAIMSERESATGFFMGHYAQKLVNRADTAVLTVHIKDTAIVGGTGY